MFQKEDRGEDVEWRLKGRAWIIPLTGTQEEKLHRIKIWLFMTLVCWSAFYDFCFFSLLLVGRERKALRQRNKMSFSVVCTTVITCTEGFQMKAKSEAKENKQQAMRIGLWARHLPC